MAAVAERQQIDPNVQEEEVHAGPIPIEALTVRENNYNREMLLDPASLSYSSLCFRYLQELGIAAADIKKLRDGGAKHYTQI